MTVAGRLQTSPREPAPLSPGEAADIPREPAPLSPEEAADIPRELAPLSPGEAADIPRELAPLSPGIISAQLRGPTLRACPSPQRSIIHAFKVNNISSYLIGFSLSRWTSRLDREGHIKLDRGQGRVQGLFRGGSRVQSGAGAGSS